jgi:chromosome segregation ATPase
MEGLSAIRDFWQKALKRIGWQPALPRSRVLQRRLTGVREENRALRLELEAVQDAIEAGIDRQAQAMSAMQEQVEHLQEERAVAAQEVEDLRKSLTLAVSRQESTEHELRALDTTLQKTRASHRAEMQEADERLRRQGRRSNGALLTAGLAILLAAVTTITGIRDVREHTRILAGVSRDLRDIKQAMEEQMSGSRRDLQPGDRLARTDAPAIREQSDRGVAEGGNDEMQDVAPHTTHRETGAAIPE